MLISVDQKSNQTRKFIREVRISHKAEGIEMTGGDG